MKIIHSLFDIDFERMFIYFIKFVATLLGGNIVVIDRHTEQYLNQSHFPMFTMCES